MNNIAFLLVTCCKEQSRAEILAEVLKNLGEQAPELRETLTVFDNASTVPGTIDVLRDRYTHVYQADHNVGYWSAIDWFLDHVSNDPPSYVYIIESDMIHYNFKGVKASTKILDKRPDLGAVRLHEYSIENWRLYNKDAPLPNSRRNLWQSHTNKVTGQPVQHVHEEGGFWRTNFLTQLPALNRYSTMKRCFEQLHFRRRFTELDFQRFYHDEYPQIAILDGGAFNCDLNPYGSPGAKVAGSWADPKTLAELNYLPTRIDTIEPHDRYTVRRI